MCTSFGRGLVLFELVFRLWRGEDQKPIFRAVTTSLEVSDRMAIDKGLIQTYCLPTNGLFVFITFTHHSSLETGNVQVFL